MVEEFTNTDEMQSHLHHVLQEKFGHKNKLELEGGKRKKASKKASKKSSLSLEGGKRKKTSKKASKKASKKSSLSLEGGKRKKKSKKTSKKASKKASKKSSKRVSKSHTKSCNCEKSSLEGGSKKSSKKSSKKASKSSVKRGTNPYMMARSALIKVMFAKAKSKEFKLTVPDSAKIIKKIEEEVIQKHKLTDKVEILKKALEFFNSNVDKYLKV